MGYCTRKFGGYFEVTIRDLNIERNGVPLEIKGSQAPSAIKLEERTGLFQQPHPEALGFYQDLDYQFQEMEP